MKKLILTILTTITILGLNAQGNNLQFNKVENLTFTTTNNSNNSQVNAGSFTVPANKVWKIVSLSRQTQLPSALPGGFQRVSAFFDIYINDINIKDSGFPIWLQSGTYVLFFGFDSNISLYPVNTNLTTLSSIEFNIVQ